MSLPRYPEYKDSAVAWLSEMPAQWSWSSLKWISRRYSGGTPDKTRHEFWQDGNVPWLSSGAVNDQQITEPSAYITEQAFNNSSAKWIPSGALVMALAGQGKTKGMVAQVTFETTCNQSMAAIVPSPEIDTRFLYWWLVSNYQNIRNMSGGDHRDGLNLELLGAIPCPLPSGHEQHAIATFLDRETAKIDALIAEQEKLLALLAEKRQATISHAVTKGLNPNAPMKDSGIPWLGEVPAHWELRPVKSFGVLKGGAGFPDAEQGLTDEEIGFYKVASLGKADAMDFLLPAEHTISQATASRLGAYIFPEGTVVFAKVGAALMLGRIRCLRAPACIDNNMMGMLVAPDNDVSFVKWAMSLVNFDLIANPGAVPSLNASQIGNYQLARPGREEQVAISDFIQTEVGVLEQLRAEAQCAIDLLEERRSAMISAAVTGKIDVRHAA